MLFLTLGLALVLVPLLVFGQGNNTTGPAISISPDDYNTGDISRMTQDVTQVFTVSNTGKALLSIAKIKYT
ncbi:MAG: hypothetical protein HY892_14470 [Deltaproteobacteria bacterium]|nr:hypothetical protein [Deltaproteobacteria bacterium]